MIENIAIIITVINILVYFKAPEFLQTLIVKRLDKRIAQIQIENDQKINQIQLDFQREYQKVEQEFTTKLEIYIKRYTVLPELYKLIAEFEAAVNQTDNRIFPSSKRDVLNRFGSAKNFRTLNQFYLTEELLDISDKCITTIFDYYTEQTKLETCKPELIDIFNKSVHELKETKENYMRELEKQIREIMSN